MTKKNSEAAEEKDENDEAAADPAEDDVEEEEEEEEKSDKGEEGAESSEDDEEEEDDEEVSDSELDLDAELDVESKRGKPDPKKAHERIKEKENEDDKPITRKEARELQRASERKAQEDVAYQFALRLTRSEKEARLVFLKWQNRSFPSDLPLAEQVEEAFAITHRKALISQRNEALRSLKNKDAVNRNSAITHRDPPDSPSSKTPKGMPPQDVKAIEQMGFKWTPKNGRFEKKLKNGNLLVKYPGKDVQNVGRS